MNFKYQFQTTARLMNLQKKGISTWFILCFILFTIFPFLSTAIEDEYMMKSFYFESFSRYISWPKESDIYDKSKPFVIVVLGDNPFGPLLKNIYANKKINDKRVEIHYISKVDQIENCQILFISSSMQKELPQIFEAIKNKPILSVGDTTGYAESGVQINFYLMQNKVRFEINEPALRQAGMSISTKLLEIAKVVKSPGVTK